MGFDEGQIILDSPNGSYFPGQTIYGKLVFQEDKVKSFRGIYVKLKGHCKVHWTTSHSREVNGRRQTVHENHESEEEYVHLKVYLVGGESGEYTLQPGRHEFPFQLLIPINCPSSYEGTHGYIRYEMKVVVDRAFKIDLEKMVAVRVLAGVDLNSDPYCKEPMVFEFSDTYCCCCISYGSSETLIKLPASGYCPGQVMPIELSCNNHGSVEISEIKFKITKTTTFRAVHNPDTKTETESFGKTKTGPVSAGSSRQWTLHVEVPNMEVTNVGSCRFIDIDYELHVTVVPDGCHSDSDDSRRLVIGTVPLLGYTDYSQKSDVVQLQSNPLTTQPMGSPYPPNPYPPSATPSPYPNQTPYPNNTPYPNPGNTPYPNPSNPPYPNPSNPPYPNPTNTPYPNPTNTPYPPGNAPYPNPSNPPYPSDSNPPYPGGNPPYPGGNPPYPGGNPPYPGGNPPYPGGNPPYPSNPVPPQNMAYQTSPNAGMGGSMLKTGTVGFVGQNIEMPALPTPGKVPQENPYASASAPSLDP